jgi:DNA-binding transcriptional LysR family regulator
MIFNINQLRSFHAAAKFNSITLAASSLMVTPPAITMQIKQLEKSLGLSLMFRKGNAIQLTEIGEQVFREANIVFSKISELENFLEETSITNVGQLKIGCHHAPAKYLMPPLISRFNKIYPKTKIFLELDNSHELIKKVIRNQIPLALIAKKPEDSTLTVKPLLKDKIILVAAKGSKIIRQKKISIHQLQSLPLLTQEKDSAMADLVKQHLLEFSVEPNIVMETGSQDVMKECVTTDMALAFVERFAVQKELKAGLIREIKIEEGPLQIELGFCYLKDRQQSPVIQAFLNLIQCV